MTPPTQQRVASDGEWWVLLVTDGLTVEFPPELYREHEDADREAERWARILSRRSHSRIHRPFEDRWHIGDEWIRVTHSFLPEQGRDIWVGTYWGRDGSPEPEAALFSDGAEARAWVLEPAAGAVLAESYETSWSAAAGFRVRGGEEEAEVHRCKVISALVEPTSEESGSPTIYGFAVSEGLIPQVPDLFASSEARDQVLRRYLLHELTSRDWRPSVLGTAEAITLSRSSRRAGDRIGTSSRQSDGSSASISSASATI